MSGAARAAWVLGGCVLVAVAAVSGFFGWFGWEAVQTGANVTGWLSLFVPGVVLPLLGCAGCLWVGLRPRADRRAVPHDGRTLP